MHGFDFTTAPVTMATVDGACECVILDGHFEIGETVPCPDGDHDHRILDVLHTDMAANIRIIN